MALRPLIAGQFYNSSSATSPGGSSGQVQYNNAGAFGGISGWSTNGSTALTGGVGSTLAIGGATIGSNNLAVTGTSLFTGNITQASGVLQLPDGSETLPSLRFAANIGLYAPTSAIVGISIGTSLAHSFSATQIWARSDSGELIFGSSADARIIRDGAGVLAQKNSTSAQSFRVYGTTTGPQYVQLAHNGTNGTLNVTGGGVLHISSLPTANPGAGILWNNAGTPAIGT